MGQVFGKFGDISFCGLNHPLADSILEGLVIFGSLHGRSTSPLLKALIVHHSYDLYRVPTLRGVAAFWILHRWAGDHETWHSLLHERSGCLAVYGIDIDIIVVVNVRIGYAKRRKIQVRSDKCVECPQRWPQVCCFLVTLGGDDFRIYQSAQCEHRVGVTDHGLCRELFPRVNPDKEHISLFVDSDHP